MMDFLKQLGLKEVNSGTYFGHNEWSTDDSAGLIESHNPATGELLGKVISSSEADYEKVLKQAVNVAKQWRTVPGPQRGEAVRLVGEALREHKDALGSLVAAEMGKIKSEGDGEVQEMIDMADFAVGQSRMMYGNTMHSERPGHRMYDQWHPLGVVGIICPWNLPLLLMTWKVAPALAAGNTLVVNPSEETPATATLLAEVMHEVGIPHGVFNLVHGFGPGSCGEAITSHPDVQAITFTGESATGSAIMKKAADGMKAVSFELGGKNPAIVFADADFDAAIDGTMRSVFTNCGQVCLCSERVYVERPIYDRFVETLASRAGDLVAGDPYQPETSFGPLISKAHRDKVLSYYALAKTEGATVVTGGGVPELGAPYDDGFFIEPTIWTGLSEQARCVREEIFGPVCHIQPFDDEAEVIAMANDSQYGLAAAVWTQNVSRAHRVPHQLETGIVWVNSWYLRDLRTPFGGVKQSGIGREGGIYSINFYSELKNICIKL